MDNKVYYVSQIEMIEIREVLKKDKRLYIGEINGSAIQSLEDYLKIINEVFMFPIPSRSLDSYFDWIRDLDWLMKDGYALIINDFSKFIKNDIKMKNKIVEDFERIVLPWWQDEVKIYVVEGKIKPFNVYLVD